MPTKNSSHPKWNNPIEFHSTNLLREFIFPDDILYFYL